MNLLIFDTETTGIKDAELIQFASIYDNGEKKPESISFDMKPSIEILPSSTVVHGITQDEANKYRDPTEVNKEIFDYLKKLDKPVMFVAHNINYDIDIMNREFQKYLDLAFNPKISLDTMRFAKKIIPYDEIGGYSLDAIYYYFFPTRLKLLFKKRNIHSALSDCELTYQILLKLKELYDKQNGNISEWADIIRIINKPFDLSETEWKFGKHKGIKIKDTPRGYIDWCLKSDFAEDPKNADIVYTLKNIKDKLIFNKF